MKSRLSLLFFILSLILNAQPEKDNPHLNLEEIDQLEKIEKDGSCFVWVSRFCMRDPEEVTAFVYDAINPAIEASKPAGKTRYCVFTLNFKHSWLFPVAPGQHLQVWVRYPYKKIDARIVLKGFCTEFEDKDQAESVQKQVQQRINKLEELLIKHRLKRQLITIEEKDLKRAIEDDDQATIEAKLKRIDELEKEDEKILEKMQGLNNEIQQLHQIKDIRLHYKGCALIEQDVILFKLKHKLKPPKPPIGASKREKEVRLKYEEIQEEKEEDPGLKLCVNTDDDNEDLIEDIEQDVVDGEDDLGQVWYFWARPVEDAGHEPDSPLIISTNSDKIKLWKKPEKVELANLAAGSPKIVPQSIKFKRERMYIEATKASEKKAAEDITARFYVTMYVFVWRMRRFCRDRGLDTNIGIKFLDANKDPDNPIDQSKKGLHIGKWLDAFKRDDPQNEKDVKDDFVEIDPDRFHVMVEDAFAWEKQDSVEIEIRSESDDVDKPIKVKIPKSQKKPVFISKAMLLMSDDVDDDFVKPSTTTENSKAAKDNDTGDLTYRATIGSYVKVQYTAKGEKEEEEKCEKKIRVCDPPIKDQQEDEIKTVKIKVIILRSRVGGDPATRAEFVKKALVTTNERYTQCCMKVELVGEIRIVDPSEYVDLSNGLQIEVQRLSSEERALFDAYGTPDDTDDIVVFYLNSIFVDRTQGFGWSEGEDRIKEIGADEEYANNVLIAAWPTGPFVLAHELMHILLDSPHKLEGPDASKPFHLFHKEPVIVNTVIAAKRIIDKECKKMRDSHLVERN